MAWRFLQLVMLTAVLAIGGAGSAQAAELAVEDGVVVYTAAPGEVNELAIFPACLPQCLAEAPDAVNVYMGDVTAVTPGPGCFLAVDIAFPPFVGPAYWCTGVSDGGRVELGDEDDYFEGYAPGGAPITVDGGEGNDFVGMYDSDDAVDGGAGDDQLYGGHGDDVLLGGDGNDEINGDYGGFADGEEVFEDLDGAGSDTLDGGAGDDRLQGNGGADVLIGGAGLDTAIFNARRQAVTVTLDGQADDGQSGEHDQASPDIEAVATGLGNDTVRGSDGPNTITTGAGHDTIDLGGGEDNVDAGAGSDAIEARDGAADRIGCGDGADIAAVDAADLAGFDCEQQTGAPRGTGTTTPLVRPIALVLKVQGKLRKGQRRVRLAGELRLPAGSDQRLCAGASVIVKVRAARARQATATLGGDCRFSIAVPMRVGRGTLVASARFPGTSAIGTARSRSIKVRVRR